MVFAKLFAAHLALQFSLSNAALVRDLSGNWVEASWAKRSGPGSILKVPMTNNNDKSYSTPVRMGTPFQEIEMALSLSQNHILVQSPETGGLPGFYNISASKSSIPSNATTTVPGLDGQMAQVDFVGETCQVLDFNYNASVGITPSSFKGKLYPDSCHGILGYGVDPAPKTPPDSTLLGVYIPKGVPAAECGIELGRASDGGLGGIFTMGGRDTDAFTGDFTSLTVPPASGVDRPSWSVHVDGIYANPSGQMESVADPGLASIDLYYPTISIPADAAKQLYAKINRAAVSPNNTNRYLVPCDASVKLMLAFGGKNFTLDPRDSITKEGDDCYGTVEVNQGNVYKIGSPFMRNVYTIFGASFDAAGAATFTVGFADKVQRVISQGATSTAPSQPKPTSSSGSSTNAGLRSLPPVSLLALAVVSIPALYA